MNQKRYLITALLIGSALVQATHAGIPGNEALGDHAVLQRGDKTPIWGTGKPGSPVKVAFQGKEWNGTVGEDGTWKVYIGPLKPHGKDVMTGDDLTCTVSGQTFTLKDILVGDVWLCLGQSNMERRLRHDGYPSPVDGDTRDYPNLRINNRVYSKDLPKQTLEETSALAYHFGRNLLRWGDVPVGIYVFGAGSQSIQFFLSEEKWNKFLAETTANPLNDYQPTMLGGRPCGDPSRMWKGMAATGLYFDQGEANITMYPTYYGKLLDLLQEQLSEYTGHPRLPMVLAHKPSCTAKLDPKHGKAAWVYYDAFNYVRGGEEYATVAEWQRRWAQADPQSRVVVASHDMRDACHFWGKTFHARRAAQAALALTQGKDLPIRAPEPTQTVAEGNRLRLKFSTGGLTAGRWQVKEKIGPDFAGEWAKLSPYELGKDGVVVKWISRTRDATLDYADWVAHVRVLDAKAPLAGFAVAGADAVLYPAQAVLEGDTVVVSNPDKVPQPVYAAYGFSTSTATPAWLDSLDWNLYGKNGLPVLPFWTGPWPPSKIPGNAWVKCFKPDANGIVKGGETTLRWEVEGVDTVTIEPGIGNVPAKGERVVRPTEPTEYILRVPKAWPAGETHGAPHEQTTLVNGERVVQYTFKPWKAEVIPTGLAKPATVTGDLEPTLRILVQERAKNWDGALIKEIPNTPHSAGAVIEAVRNPVDLVMEGLIKFERTGLARLVAFDHGGKLNKDHPDLVYIVEIGGLEVINSVEGRMQGTWMVEKPGYYPVRILHRGNHGTEWRLVRPGMLPEQSGQYYSSSTDIFWHVKPK
jgi:hypothetical protein